MKVSVLEQQAIQRVCMEGKAFGYGNLISHLKAAWAADLMQEYGFTEKQAQQAAGGGGLSVAIHRDILINGQWDETGERYRK